KLKAVILSYEFIQFKFHEKAGLFIFYATFFTNTSLRIGPRSLCIPLMLSQPLTLFMLNTGTVVA
ncbi:hypothetical protein ACQP3J_29720, partial [Escherichia coli]